MQHFSRIEQNLHIENVSLSDVAEKFGTPCYVYSRASIETMYDEYANALVGRKGTIAYAVKANSNIAVLQVLAKKGAGFDIVSIGELERVLMAGGDPKKVIFSGVGKQEFEMIRAMEIGIGCFNVESEAELHALSNAAVKADKIAPISLRINPDVDAKTHPYISTGLKENKFGIDINQAVRIYDDASKLPNIKIVGADCHIGSQLTAFEPFMDALDRMLGLVDALKEKGIELEHLDLGGGIGICYNNEVVPSISEFVATVADRVNAKNLALMLEPGRSIVGNSGALLTKVVYLKPGEHKNFAIVDAAMNDNLRPSLYQAWQSIVPLVQRDSSAEKVWDVVGPVCETGDFIGKDRSLAIEAGDYLAMLSTGAYGFAMSSNYNTRGRAAEVLVDGDQVFLIRERETFVDQVKGEHLLDEK